MEDRSLGGGRISVPVVGLGTWRRLEAAAAAGRHRELIGAAIAAGIRLIDTSPMYGGAERLLAAALEGRRSQVLLADKIWTPSPEEGAAQLARARSGTNVLFLSVDLCSLCLRPQDDSVTMFVATALFGDGAAGVVLRHESRASGQALPSRASIVASGEHFWRQTEHIMGWDIKNDGFGVVLSPELTQLLRHRFQSALDGFLAREGLTLKDFDGFLFHPGGRKVLECLASMLNVTPADLAHSWAVLKNYGNMSSATALFVLERALASNAKGRHLLGAFGPGFSAYFVVVDLFWC